MSLYRPSYRDPNTNERKQSAIWWYEFTVGGRRIRESSGTTKKTLARAIMEKRRDELERAAAGLPGADPSETRPGLQRVADVLDRFEHGFYVGRARRTIATAKSCLKAVRERLGSLHVPELSEERILAYIVQR